MKVGFKPSEIMIAGIQILNIYVSKRLLTSFHLTGSFNGSFKKVGLGGLLIVIRKCSGVDARKAYQSQILLILCKDI